MAAMTDFRVELATESDDAAIRGMCRTQAMPGRIRVTFEREPEFSIGCRVAGDDCQIVVARAAGSGEIAGFACRSARRVFVNGSERRLGYLSQLRIAPEFQGRWLVSRGFRALREMHEADPLPAYLMAIVDGNREATGVLVRNRRKGFPTLHSVAELRTLAISVSSTKPAIRCDAEITAAGDSDRVEIAAFLQREGGRRQFFPACREDSLRSLAAYGLRMEHSCVARRGGEIIGVVALWDQSSYKQTVVQGYSGWLRAAAPIYNWSGAWMGRAALPRPGEKLRSAYAAFVCIANDDPDVFAALLREIYNRASERGFHYLLFGCDVRDPLFPVAQKYNHISYPSRLYLAEWSDGGIFHEQLDHRPVSADIATL
jgi:ribosomal protein S18 acetylase RimI-like enzyme